MDFQRIRFFLLIGLALVGSYLFNVWQQEQSLKKASMLPRATHLSEKNHGETPLDVLDIPDLKEGNDSNNLETLQKSSLPIFSSKDLIDVKTKVMHLKINKNGGDIVYLSLPQFKDDKNLSPEHTGYVLLDEQTKHYIAQIGLSSKEGPEIKGKGRANYQSAHKEYVLNELENQLTVDLKTTLPENINITKRFIFNKDSYLIKIEYIINNQSPHEYIGQLYGRLKRKPKEEKSSFFSGAQTFTGLAMFTPEKPYTKLTFKDIKTKPIEKEVMGGWAAQVEQYFLSAFIPPKDKNNFYHAKAFEKDTVGIEFITEKIRIKPQSTGTVETLLYTGPQVTEDLEKISKGLQLTVDYGVLWPVCQPIFWVLKKIHSIVGNWGVSIILVTIFIKLMFYPLSSASYRSMANMRRLQPKLQALKLHHGDDKQKFGQALMDLYRKEKVNPMSGCLPMVVQIPVFIALYYVLLGSVELHHAPFFGWITDLSQKDPYYVLPLLMGASMFIQQKLSPQAPDPMQAKVMLFMPIFFTVLFLQFPTGLVLYWLVNNVLSIVQQWYITHTIELDTKRYGK